MNKIDELKEKLFKECDYDARRQLMPSKHIKAVIDWLFKYKLETILEALQAMKDKERIVEHPVTIHNDDCVKQTIQDKGVMEALEALDELRDTIAQYYYMDNEGFDEDNAHIETIRTALLAKQETDEYIQSIRDILEDVEDLRPQKEGTFGFRDTLKGKILHLKEQAKQPDVGRKYKLGDRLTKIKGSSWQGRVVGFYSTDLTPIGYAIESEREKGSVQIYPEAALKPVEEEQDGGE